jgi:hypothetical protein
VCLQETKLQTIDQSLAAFLGAYKLNSFAFKPAVGTKGGILLLWNNSEVEVSNIREGRFSLSAEVTLRSTLACFLLSYDPNSVYQEKGRLLTERRLHFYMESLRRRFTWTSLRGS